MNDDLEAAENGLAGGNSSFHKVAAFEPPAHALIRG